MQFNSNQTTSRQSFILNLPFLIGLLVLLLNDHFLKEAFGNWFTGKLSDFAGVFILPLFLKFVFMRSHRTSILATLLIFIFWKSPFSTYWIDSYNSISPISIYRVIDYSDFLAFLILPISYHVLNNYKKYSLQLHKFNTQWSTGFLLLTTLFAFIATSKEYPEAFDGSAITGCCNDLPKVDVVGNGSIFIPNIFTPDNDGINDIFYLIADTGIAKIDTFEIWHLDTDSIIFFKENIIDISPSTGWDGTFNDTIIPAQYLYAISVVSTDNIKARFTGYLCCIPCSSPTGMVTPQFLTNCGFATQYDPITKLFDPNAPSLEELDCFE